MSSRSKNSLYSTYSSSSPMMPCPDENCTFPFGDACASCTLKLRKREEKRAKRNQENDSKNYIEDLEVSAYNLDVSERPFLNQNAQSTATGPTYKEMVRRSFEVDSEFDVRPCEESEFGNRSSQSARTVIPYGSYQTHMESIRSGTTNTTDMTEETRLSRALDPWLSTLFDHTLAGHASGVDFVGGAEEQEPTDQDCPLCRKPLGDPTEQHLLKCQFAHDERQRVERMAWLVSRSTELKRRISRRSNARPGTRDSDRRWTS